MYLGNYFIYCPLSSNREKPIFRYRVIERQSHGNYINRFPVYLTFSRHTLYIGFSTFMDTSDEEKASNDVMPVSAELLSIPITPYKPWGEDPFSYCLRNIMFRKVHLSKFHEEKRINHIEWDNLSVSPVEKKFYNQRDNESGKSRKSAHSSSEKGFIFSPEEIFMDFLFDLFHTSAFDIHSGTNQLREQITSHYLCNAIFRKLDYSFWQNTIAGRSTQKLHLIEREKYFESKKERLASLNDNNSKYNHEIKRWFDTATEEARKISFENVDAELLKEVSKGKKELERESPGSAEYARHYRISENIDTSDDLAFNFFKERLDYKSASEFVGKLQYGFYLVIFYLAVVLIISLLANPPSVVFDVILLLLILSGIFPALLFMWKTFRVILFIVVGLIVFFLFNPPGNLQLALGGLGIAAVILFTWKRGKKWLGKALLWLRKDTSKGQRLSFFYPYIRMSILTMAAWCAYIPVSEEAWTIGLHLNSDRYFLALFIMFSVGVIWYIRRYQVPEYKVRGYSLSNSIFLFGSGLSFSLFFGFLVMGFSTSRLIYDESQSFMPDHRFSDPVKQSISFYKNERRFFNDYEIAYRALPDTAMISSVMVKEEGSIKVVDKETNRIEDSLFSQDRNLTTELKNRLQKNSIAEGIELRKEIEKNMPVQYYKSNLKSYIISYLDALKQNIKWAVYRLSQNPESDKGLQYIAGIKIGNNLFFYYPRLLLLYGLIAFYLGFLFEFFLTKISRER